MKRYRSVLLLFLIAGTLAASPSRTQLPQLSAFMAGNWTCSYNAGSQTATYTAAFVPMGQTTIHEHDTWSGGGGGDEAFITQDPKSRWTMVVLENGSATVFVAQGADWQHLVFRSGYPDTSMTNAFDRVSASKYTLHFTQTAGGKTTRSNDVCVKE